jgi:hypothetical protein
MSYWLRRKDPDGRVYYVGSWRIIFIFLVMPTLGIVIAVLLPLVQSCRVLLRG